MTVRTVLRRDKGISTRLIRKVTHGGGELLVGGAPARFVDRVHAGDEIKLVMPEERSGFVAQDIPLDVIYEDEHLLAINKQPGLVVHPTKGHADGTLANAVQRYMERSGEAYKIRFISRLDMDTSGVLLIGKNSLAQSDFAIQSAAGHVQKEYIALVCGVLEGSGLIDAPIALEREGSPKRTVRDDGYPSKTEYYAVRIAGPSGSEYTILRIILHTGRTHQIRVHLAHIGHPVLGDSLYGDASSLIARQALHSHTISFPHPITGKRLDLTAELHKDMKKLLVSS